MLISSFSGCESTSFPFFLLLPPFPRKVSPGNRRWPYCFTCFSRREPKRAFLHSCARNARFLHKPIPKVWDDSCIDRRRWRETIVQAAGASQAAEAAAPGAMASAWVEVERSHKAGLAEH